LVVQLGLNATARENSDMAERNFPSRAKGVPSLGRNEHYFIRLCDYLQVTDPVLR
jgi:hypothetical protein